MRPSSGEWDMRRVLLSVSGSLREVLEGFFSSDHWQAKLHAICPIKFTLCLSDPVSWACFHFLKWTHVLPQGPSTCCSTFLKWSSTTVPGWHYHSLALSSNSPSLGKLWQFYIHNSNSHSTFCSYKVTLTLFPLRCVVCVPLPWIQVSLRPPLECHDGTLERVTLCHFHKREKLLPSSPGRLTFGI